jgi:hypothetical protein
MNRPETILQTSQHAPAQPVYVLRGHGAPIHSVSFLRQNKRLLTGDSLGWVVLWSAATKRPVAVWKAHDAAILAASQWGAANIITYVRPAFSLLPLPSAFDPIALAYCSPLVSFVCRASSNTSALPSPVSRFGRRCPLGPSSLVRCLLRSTCYSLFIGPFLFSGASHNRDSF